MAATSTDSGSRRITVLAVPEALSELPGLHRKRLAETTRGGVLSMADHIDHNGPATSERPATLAVLTPLARSAGACRRRPGTVRATAP